MLRGMRMRATAIVRTNSVHGSFGVPASGVPSTWTSSLIGTDSGGGSRRASCARRPARAARLAHADDAAAAHLEPRFAHALERVEPVVVVARAHDAAVVLRRGVEVV